ncbi:MAG: ferrochelatase [Planctomycetota bacterium]|jgi:ferrochelatase
MNVSPHAGQFAMSARARIMIRIAGAVWVAVGLMLGVRGVLMLIKARAGDPPASLLALATSAALGLWIGQLKGRYVLIRSAKRNRKRLAALESPAPWNVFTLKMWLLIALMIGFGAGLRQLAANGYIGGFTFVGGLYVGLGAALFVSSIAYWRQPPPTVITRRETAVNRSGIPIGVLLVNLGTPDAPTASAVRRYLREFLSDPLVVELPRWLWAFVLNVIILPKRSVRAAEAYAKVWTEEGSPLLVQSQRAARALAARLGDSHHVVLGMRYGKPSLAAAFEELCEAGCEEIRVLPLYPQYSAATTGSTQLATSKLLRSKRAQPNLVFLPPYPDDAGFIEAFAQRIEAARGVAEIDLHVFSFHGLPEDQIRAGDPYLEHCARTSFALASRLQLKRDQWEMVFQSRFGDDPWLQPYFDEFVLSGLPARGRLLVALPAFTADCLETLEEVAIGVRDEFLAAGGEEMIVVESLNDSPVWVEAMASMVTGSQQAANVQ